MFDDSFKSRYTSIPYAYYILERSNIEYNLIPHNHKEIEIIAMTDGEADFYVGSKICRISRGDVLIIPPYCVHHAKVFPFSSYDCICFDLSLLHDNKLASDLERGILTARDVLYSKESDISELHEHIRRTVTACKEQRQGWELEIIGRLSLVFSSLVQKRFFTSSHISEKEEKFCRSIIEYVAENYGENITSSSLSKILYMNNSYFCRAFKKHFRCTFSDFLNDYRIEKAKLLLEQSNTPISEIATECGFNGFSYFGKTFKSTVGCSPSAYRIASKK